MLGPCFVLYSFVSFLVLQTPCWKKELVVDTLILFLLACGCLCFMSLARGVMDLSVVYDCGICW